MKIIRNHQDSTSAHLLFTGLMCDDVCLSEVYMYVYLQDTDQAGLAFITWFIRSNVDKMVLALKAAPSCAITS